MRQNKNSRINRNSYQTSNKNLKYMKTFESFGKDYELLLEEENWFKKALLTAFSALTIGSAYAGVGTKADVEKNVDIEKITLSDGTQTSAAVVDNTSKVKKVGNTFKFEGDPKPEMDKQGNVTDFSAAIMGGKPADKDMDPKISKEIGPEVAEFVKVIGAGRSSLVVVNISDDFTGVIRTKVSKTTANDLKQKVVLTYIASNIKKPKLDKDGKPTGELEVVQQQFEESTQVSPGGNKILDGVTPVWGYDEDTKTKLVETQLGKYTDVLSDYVGIDIEPGSGLGERIKGALINSNNVGLDIEVDAHENTEVVFKKGGKEVKPDANGMIQIHK